MQTAVDISPDKFWRAVGSFPVKNKVLSPVF